MGDRRTAEIRTKGGSLYVYTHWGGYEMPERAEAALEAAQPRIGDDAYALRIIVDQLTKAGRDQETGYGLMFGPNAEDEYGTNPSIVIDLIANKVTVAAS